MVASQERIKVSQDVDLSIFNIEAVKSACYRLADVGSAAIKSDDDNKDKAQITFSLPGSFSKSDINSFLENFNTELIDYDLRIKIRNETEVSRNLILAYAFADSKLMEE